MGSIDLGMGIGRGHHHAHGGGGGGYTGPLDLTATPAVVAYGQRALSAAKLGTALYTIRRSSDGTTQSFNSDATDGTAPVAAIWAFIGGGNGFVATWNDQSGNATDVSQATGAAQPTWLSNQVGGQPGIKFTRASSTRLASTGTASFPTDAYTGFIVYSSPDETGYLLVVGDQFNGPDVEIGMALGGTNPTPFEFAQDAGDNNGQGTFPGAPGAGANTFFVFDYAHDESHWAALINGAVDGLADSGFGTRIVPGITGTVFLGAPDNVPSSPLFDGLIVEVLLFNSLLSDADRTAIRQNIATYYGISLG